jgi:DNA primase
MDPQPDIVAVVGAVVPLVRRGSRYMACCPFHPDTVPSFAVNPGTQRFYCYGCKAMGDVEEFRRLWSVR